ncbi:MAG: VOC family protein [Bacteroidota bacterium]
MNKQVELNLLVIRSAQAARLAEFYSLLGVQWEFHRHGSGPWHYSANCAGVVLEIYPLKKDSDQIDPSLRLGFRVKDLDDLLSKFQKRGIKIKVSAKQGSWGYRAVVEDIEGRSVELVEQ